jgi:hypothetical protein
MEVKHLQSLIKRNSNRIAELEFDITTLDRINMLTYPYWKKKWKKEIKQLAILQRELKLEIAHEIWVASF